MWASWFGTDLGGGLITMITIFIMETMLSVDNAAVLALMVRKLPDEQQSKALKYGIWGAFIARGLSLCLVSVLISLWFLKIAGGAWLVWLAVKHFKSGPGDDDTNPDDSSVFKWTSKYLSAFWSTVALVEVMDMVFSMDNIFAVTAMTKLVGWVVVAVFLGIVCMRVVATWFIRVMKKFPFLENVAFVVIGVLGIKLMSTLYIHYHPTSQLTIALEGKLADYITSAITIGMFVVPVVTSLLFNLPARNKEPKGDVFIAEVEKTLTEGN
jgi:YkoY family integral membrane protein